MARLTSPAVYDKSPEDGATERDGKVSVSRETESKCTKFVLPIFVHAGPCFVQLQLGVVITHCECMSYLEGLEGF